MDANQPSAAPPSGSDTSLSTARQQVEAALRLSEERLQLALLGADLGTWDWQVPTGAVAFNERWLAMLGYAPDEIAPHVQAWEGLIHPDDRLQVMEVLNAHLAGKTAAYESEHRLRHKSGDWVWVLDKGRVIQRDAQGKPLRACGTHLDITQRKLAEERHREREEQHQLILQTALDGFWLVNQAGTLLEVNAAYCQMSGYSAAELTGMDVARLEVNENLAATAAHIQQVMARGEDRFESQHRRKDGSHFDVEVSVQYNATGQQRLIYFLRDITEHKRMEEALKCLATSFAHLSGRAFFEAVSRHIALTIGVDFVFVGQLNPAKNGVTVLGGWAQGQPMSEFTYSLAGTPCENVMGKQACIYPAGVQARFPQDQYLVQLGIEGYLGAPIFDKQQQAIGILVALHSQPLTKPEAVSALFNTFLDRISAEMQRHTAEDALRQGEQNYREIFNAPNEAIFLHDAVTGRIVDVNDAMLRLYGFATKAEVLAANIGNWDANEPPYTQADALRHIQRAVAEGPQVFKWWDRKKDGTRFWVEVSLRSSEIGGRGRILAVVRDITERQRAEDEVKRLSQWLLKTQHLSRVGGWAFNLKTGEVWVSPEARHIYGFDPHEFITIPRVQSAALLNYRPRLDQALRELVENQHPYDVEFQICRRTDGATVDIHSLAEYNAEENTVMGVIEDVTERKRAEESHTRLATVVEQAAETIVITDPQGTIIYANPAFEKTTGYTRAEAVGKNPRVLKSGKQDAEYYRQMWTLLERGEVWHGHFINRRKNGTLYEEEATISPVRDATGKIVNYVAIKNDVTHEMQLETQLRQSQKMEAIGQLAGGVAHDFNNILSSILMQTELVGMVENLPAEANEGLTQIRTDTERAATLTRQLLLFSRRQVMQVQNLDLNESVTSLAKMLQRIIGEDVRLQLNLHPTPLQIRADPGMLDQVLMNLAVNARDAMPDGGRLRIETSEKEVDETIAEMYPDAAPGRYACVRVSDTGGGIPPEVLPRIFEPFFTTKEAGKGTGLGLATVFGIVKQHRGWLKVDNQLGRGATFHVFIPVLGATATDPAVSIARPKPRGGTETILLVEDEASVRKSTKAMLEHSGYRVLEAANGVEALALWREQRRTVALLLTDLVMPGGLTGKDLARRLQTEESGLKVIYTSGYSGDIAGRELQLRPGENFIPKPFTSDHLLHTVRQCLDS